MSSLPGSRAALGQWFTPPHVADLALKLTLSGCTDGRVLDPCCGDGGFLSRAVRAGVPAANLAGIEVEPAAAAACRRAVPGARIDQVDLFDLTPPTPGFDAVVGNPPYVRGDRLSLEQKRRIRSRLRADWPELPGAELDALVGRGDLAAPCLLRALRFARPGARVSLVVSSALLDAGYSSALWRLVSRVAAVRAIIDAPNERWFADAAVNAIIVVLERGGSVGDVTVARLRVPTREAAKRVSSLGDLESVAELRTVDAHRVDRWAATVRAASAWFHFEVAAGDRLVPLSAVAELRRGLTSGANDVFYLSRERAAVEGLEPELLRPLVRSPRGRGTASIEIDPANTSHLVLACPPGPELDRFPNARRYLDRRADAASRPTLRARPCWWSLPVRPARLFFTKAYASRFVQRWSRVPLVADQRVYSLYPAPGVDTELLAAVLNSTFSAFTIESLGRASMGEGALELSVADAAQLPVLDPRAVDGSARDAFLCLARRPIGPVSVERDRADRAALDRAVAPGLAELLPAIHAGLVASTARRAARARHTPNSSL